LLRAREGVRRKAAPFKRGWSLYIAITVALLVSSYKQQGASGDPPEPAP